MSDTPRDELERDLELLAGRRHVWAEMPLGRRVSYARSVLEEARRVAPEQVWAACAARGVDSESPRAGEEWIAGPAIFVRCLRILTETLGRLRDGAGRSFAAGDLRTVPGGRLAVRVMPADGLDRAAWLGIRAEVWMADGVDAGNLPEHVASRYREGGGFGEGEVALVLGAGNVNSIPALDAVHELFAEGRVVLLKLNPVNAYLSPIFERLFAPLVADGFVRLAVGGAETGAFLCAHPRVEKIHVTGSTATHDAIVFGTGPEGERRKAAGEPLLAKPITSELGNVSPLVVVPGAWSDRQLAFQAERVATQITQNNGFNCNATRVIVTSAGWPQRERFLAELEAVLRRLPARRAWYPGAEERWRRFTAFSGSGPEGGRERDSGELRVCGEVGDGVLPPALVVGVDWQAEGEPLFAEESFCSVAAETALPEAEPAAFLERAVQFCNARLFGDLSAGILVDPATERALGPALDEAIAGLDYGAVAVNGWAALAFGLGVTPWGAAPGNTIERVESGIGWVHNGLLLDRPAKSVVRAPFQSAMRPVWFVTHRNAHRAGRRLVGFEATRRMSKLPLLAAAAVAG